MLLFSFAKSEFILGNTVLELTDKKEKFVIMANDSKQFRLTETTETLRAETTDLKEGIFVPGSY